MLYPCAVRRSALALSLLALAFPATAFAQSAGDNQYQDPFANQGSSSPSSNSGSTSSPSTSSSGTTPSSTGTAGTTGSTSGDAAGSPSAQAGTSASSGQLPFTGYDDIFTGVAGAVLLLGGVTVRASVRDRR